MSTAKSLLGLLLVCVLATALAAQGTSNITGTVTDESGAAIGAAKVVITHEETGVKYEGTTTTAGVFAFSALPLGKYTVTVTMSGFQTFSSRGNVLNVGAPTVIDAVLKVGAVTQTVEVASRAEQIQTSSAAIGDVVEHKAVVDLPLNGRNPLTLLVLEPGVIQRSYGGAGSGIHVNGSRDRAYNVTIDGIEANESTVPNPVSNLYRLTPDQVQEYRVTTNNATAEEGRNSGASVSIATKGGSNDFHGNLFEVFRNEALNSNEFYANGQGQKKPVIRVNQYGLDFGGPLKKNKTFFYFAWSYNHFDFTQPLSQTFGAPTMYTPSALAGKYRYWVADPNPANQITIGSTKITRNTPLLVNPQTGALQPGITTCATATSVNCVATFDMFANDPKHIGADPTIAKLFGSYPLPNDYSIGDGLNTASYNWNPPTQVRGPSFAGRVDHNFDANNNVFARWLSSDYNTLKGDPLNGRPQVFPGFPPEGEVFRTTKNLAVGWRRVLSPTMVNEMTLGFSRFLFLFTQGEANPDWPNVVPYSFANASSPLINTPRTFRAVTTPQILDNFSIVKNTHVIRMGFNFRFYEHNDQRGQPGGVNVTPTLSFSATVRPPTGFNTPALSSSSKGGINSTDNTRLLGSINDILGIPARLSQVFLGDLNSNNFLPFKSGNVVTLWDEGHRLKQYNFFAQDEWRVRRNLTINYGVRWEINLAPTEAGGRVYIPSSTLLGNNNASFVHADTWFQNNNLGAIGPRLGIAWSPRNSQRTVVRVGWGIAFDPLSTFQVTAVAGKVPGLTFSCASVVGGSTTPTCASTPDVRIGQGFPLELAPPTSKPSAQLTPPVQLLSNSPSLTLFDQNYKMPTVHQWNFSIQHELPGGFVTQASYIGRRGLRLQRAYDVNQINADSILPSFAIMQQNYITKKCNPDGTGCPAGVTGTPVPLVTSGALTSSFVNSSTTQSDLTLNGAGNFAGRAEQTTLALKLRPNQQFGTITYIDSGGDSYYHALQLTVRKRFEAGLLLGAAYTFGKSIDDQSVDPVGASSGGGLSSTTSRAPADTRTWRNERARSDFDRTHVFTLNYLYDLPFGKGKRWLASAPGVANAIVGGWSLTGILTAMTGEPFSVRSGVLTSNFSHQSRADIVGTKPDATLQEVPGVLGPVLFPNANGFAQPAPGGDGAGRNIFVGPKYVNFDMGISKAFNITERFKTTFRVEMFNALNHPNFDNPVNASVGSPAITSTVFGQACCATVAPPATQTIIQTGESARVIQLQLRVTF